MVLQLTMPIISKEPGDKTASLPGQGWIYVRAAELSPRAILESLEKGEFYASTGVELKDYQADDKKITITIREISFSKYKIQFIGKGGRILSEVSTNPAVYQFNGDEKYAPCKSDRVKREIRLDPARYRF